MFVNKLKIKFTPFTQNKMTTYEHMTGELELIRPKDTIKCLLHVVKTLLLLKWLSPPSGSTLFQWEILIPTRKIILTHKCKTVSLCWHPRGWREAYGIILERKSGREYCFNPALAIYSIDQTSSLKDYKQASYKLNLRQWPHCC